MGKVRVRYVTLAFLERKRACFWAIKAFKKLGKRRISLKTALNIVRKMEHPDWEAWLLARPKFTELLLEYGADVNAGNDYALRWTSMNGYLEVVRLLLEHGANVHADDDLALQRASVNGHLEVVGLLLEYGANVHANNDLALRWASENDHLGIVQLLQKAA